MKTIRQWAAYWLRDPFWGGVDILTVYCLRLLSIKHVSNAGAFLGAVAGKYRYSDGSRQAFKNLKQILPDKSNSEINHIIDNMWEHAGRTIAEMAILDEIVKKGIMEVTFSKEFRGFQPATPTIFLFPHLGNWELLAHYVMTQGYKLNVVYEHLPNRFQRKIAKLNRQRIGYELISPNFSGAKKIINKLQKQEAIGLAIDEFKNGKVVSPAYGRSLSHDSNISYAVKLAKRFNARIFFGSCVRTSKLTFKVYCQPLNVDVDNKEIAQNINDLLESWIKKYPEQWYMLHRLTLN